ncbi:MAG: succinate--CoA ligase subunit alpha [Gammaproteobacteria bacterium]|nr:succinate--CoA ligase subunit alpha [Gammaproteobacteria bacterium]
MAILINQDTKILIQGFTGQIGTFHAQEMLDYGTNVVGGVTPGKGGGTHLGRPVFNSVKEAVEQTGAEASIVFVPPPFAADSIMEAAEGGIRYCVSITDGIPAQDMLRVKRYMRRFRKEQRMCLTGPNCAGTISPGKGMLGIMPGHIYKEGNVGIIGRSGTLGYEAASQLKEVGIGVSTSVGIGGDPINGSSFMDHLVRFEEDPDTDAIIMIGEIGGPQEVQAAEFFRDNMTKPVVSYIVVPEEPEKATYTV